jgi:hypothetical protein
MENITLKYKNLIGFDCSISNTAVLPKTQLSQVLLNINSNNADNLYNWITSNNKYFLKSSLLDWLKEYYPITASNNNFSGNYADLEGIPNFHKVAYSGNYNDLINKPSLTIPAALKNPYPLTILKNNTFICTYDGSNAVSCNLSIPTKTSDLNKDDVYTKEEAASKEDLNAITTKLKDTNTWRPIKVGGYEILGAADSRSLDFRAGANITLLNNNGVITISSTSSGGSGGGDANITIGKGLVKENDIVMHYTPTKETVENSTTIGPSSNAKISNGDEFQIPSLSIDEFGHIYNGTTVFYTIDIPTASEEGNGLMSKEVFKSATRTVLHTTASTKVDVKRYSHVLITGDSDNVVLTFEENTENNYTNIHVYKKGKGSVTIGDTTYSTGDQSGASELSLNVYCNTSSIIVEVIKGTRPTQ